MIAILIFVVVALAFLSTKAEDSVPDRKIEVDPDGFYH
jgi:hypothetical protein